MDTQQDSQPLLDVGIWLGRKQAFSAVAGRCSAADAECLRKIHENKAYRSLGMTWDQFCKEKVGITRPVVDKVIRQLEEFGPAFFQLASILRITADEYRLIVGSVAEDSVVYGRNDRHQCRKHIPAGAGGQRSAEPGRAAGAGV